MHNPEPSKDITTSQRQARAVTTLMSRDLAELRAKKSFICDMDGVIYHGSRLLEGVKEFVRWLQNKEKNFVFLTNSSERSPRELRQKLLRLGLDVGEEHFYTSALATAHFLSRQMPGAGVYAIGESGLLNALYETGLTMNDVEPDYVVVGETSSFNYEKIERAVHLIRTRGAKLVATNPDVTGPGENGIIPACGALVAPIEMASGIKAYFVGKPNPLMMRTGLKMLGCHSSEAAMIGDRYTDLEGGKACNTKTIGVLYGYAPEGEIEACHPDFIAETVQDLYEYLLPEGVLEKLA